MALRTIREFGDEVLNKECNKSTEQRHVRYHV